MTHTKTNKNVSQKKEKRSSRLKQTKQYILSNSITGILNNQKWKELFDWLDSHGIAFKLRILLSKDEIDCDWIRELEDTSILIDDSGDFIEFYEIESIKTKYNRELIEFLKPTNFDYNNTHEEIEIYGYKK